VTASSTRPLGLAALGFLELDPPAFVDVAARAGFGSVTLRTRAATQGGVEYPVPAGGPRAIETLARVRDTGVAVTQIELIALTRALDVRDCRPMLEDGAALGATRVVATGDDPDDEVVAARLAALCELAAGLGMSVDLEFMPFRCLATLPQALDVLGRAAQPNARVMVDTLHLFRSGGSVEALRDACAERLGICQLCDAPLAPPPAHLLATEARERRLLPGTGGLPLHELLRSLPPGTPLAAEVPLAGQHPELSAAGRARLLFEATCALVDRVLGPVGRRT
jgi:sugar phosphate isomerase/epimerase